MRIDQYAAWLKVGLQEYMFERRGRRAFPGTENYIEQQGDISEDIAAIVKALNFRDQEEFRRASAVALRSLDFSIERDALVSQEILRLGAKIRALDLLKVLAEKAFTLPDNTNTDRLYELAFEFARDLADMKRPDALDCLHHLIRVPKRFREALSGSALFALTEADPDDFANHFDLLRQPLDRMFGYRRRRRRRRGHARPVLSGRARSCGG
jgi:hypothetical protein